MTTTPRLQIPRQTGGQAADLPAALDDALLRLDAIAAADDQGLYAARPAAGVRGSYYFATDGQALFRDTGSAWSLVAALAPELAGTDLTAAIANPLFDGQRFTVVPQPTSQPTVRWVFERRAGSWVRVSGEPLWFASEGVVSLQNSTTFQGFKEIATVPLKGDWWVEGGCRMSSNGRGIVAVRPTTEAATDARAVVDGPAGVNQRGFREAEVPAGRVYGFVQRLVSGTSMTSASHTISLLPIRVTP